MNCKLILTNELSSNLDSVPPSTIDRWNIEGYLSKEEIILACINKLNSTFDALNIIGYEFSDNAEIFEQTSTYFGLIKNEENKNVGYVSVIPSNYETRTGILSQQLFPMMSVITNSLRTSRDHRITNLPIFIINLNEANLTKAIAISIVSGDILGFNYIDLYERDYHQILIDSGLNPYPISLRDYVLLLESGRNGNHICEVDFVNKKVVFLPNLLKDGKKINNEAYWFVLKAYAVVYLASRENFTIDMTKFNVLKRGNKTLETFRNYIAKIEGE